MSSIAPSSPWSVVATAVLAAALGVVSSLLADRRLAAPPKRDDRPFRIDRPGGEPVEVSPAKSLLVPFVTGDFDLVAELSLPAGGALDLVLRKVEPRLLPGGDMPLFHGRFVVLRLSATGEGGPAFRSREQALFSPGPGHELAAELPATVLVEARGRQLRANVAGTWHGPFEATDAHGDLALVAHGGTSLVHSLRIDPRSRPLELVPAAHAGLVAALLGLLLGLRGRRAAAARRRVLAALLALPATAWLAGGLVLGHELPATEPEVSARVLAALSGVPLVVLLAFRSRSATAALVRIVLAAALVLGIFEVIARIEVRRLAPLEDPRLDAAFGALSGTAPFDALAKRLHARGAVHTVEAVGERIVFLGGGPLYEGDGDFAGLVAARATANASRELGRALDATVAPTLFGNAGQQLAMFERFYAERFAPRAIVFAIPPWEGEASERPASAWLGDADPLAQPPADRPLSVLCSLWSTAAATPVPTTDPTGLRRTLDRLAALAARERSSVLIVDDEEVPAELRAVVDRAVHEHGFARASLSLAAEPEAAVAALTDALVAMLRT